MERVSAGCGSAGSRNEEYGAAEAAGVAEVFITEVGCWRPLHVGLWGGAQMATADNHMVGDSNFENRKDRKQKTVKFEDADERHRFGESCHFPSERGPGWRPWTVRPRPAGHLTTRIRRKL